MSRFGALLKMNVKLLFRNKGFLFFLCITPIVSAIILNLKTEVGIKEEQAFRTDIIELKNSSSKALYQADTSAYIVKVYDGSATELSDYLLEKLAVTGMFSVCRCYVNNQTEAEVEEQAKKDAFDDRAGTLLYLKKDFEACVLAGDYKDALQIYSVSEDERWDLFEEELTDILLQIHRMAEYVGMDSGKVMIVLQSVEEGILKKQVINLSGKHDVALTDEQNSKKSQIGYAFAIITLGFVFCGVCVAHTVIEEQNNKVYTRVMLSKLTRQEYFCAKFMVSLVVSLVQTLILGICIFTVKDMDFGIHKYEFLVLILCLGIIFCTISFLLGILTGDVMSSNFAVFTLWSVSALLSGLYFSLDHVSTSLKAISYLMPQRWFLKAVEMLLTGDKGAYSMVLYITMAYLILSISVGSVGLKMKRLDS